MFPSSRINIIESLVKTYDYCMLDCLFLLALDLFYIFKAYLS